jgi:anaerobic nitric oxide reductase transcription regulator
LEHVILRAVVRASGGRRGEPVEIHRHHLDIAGSVPSKKTLSPADAAVRWDVSLALATAEFQRSLIGEALALCHGNWTEAARRLGVDRSNLYRLARRLGLRQGARSIGVWGQPRPLDNAWSAA